MTDIQHFARLIKDISYAMLTTFDEGTGQLCSRPMTLQKIEFDGDLWFFVGKNSKLIQQINHNSKVNVSFADPSKMSYVSASGNAIATEDKEKAKQLWNPFYKAWFPEGIDDPNLGLIKIVVESADYWESPHSKVEQIYGMAKAAFTGKIDPDKIGQHGHLTIHH